MSLTQLFNVLPAAFFSLVLAVCPTYLPILGQVRRQLMFWRIGNNNVIGGHGHYYGTLGNNGSCTAVVTMCHREHRIRPASLRGLAI